MIRLKFELQNPFNVRQTKQHDYLVYSRKLTKHRGIDLQITKFNAHNIFEFELDLRWFGHDHQGPNLGIEVFGFAFLLTFPCNLHWDYDKDTWDRDNSWAKDQ